MISIVEAACLATQALGLFGTRFTMEWHFYSDEFSKHGITLVVPDLQAQVYIHDKYMSELVHGVFLPETRERLLAIVNDLRKQQGIEV